MSGPDRYLSGPFFVQCDSGDLWVILGYSASLHGGDARDRFVRRYSFKYPSA